MNLRKDSGSQKLIIAVLTLFLVQLACGGIAPTDPNIPVSFNYVAGQFDQMLDDLNLIPFGGLRPPLITKIESASISGLGSFEFPPKTIRLYLLELQGCLQEPGRKKLLGETTTDTGLWTILYSLKPGEVVGATQVSDGEESGLSNPVTIDQDKAFTLGNADKLQQTDFFLFQPILLTGSGLAGACVIVQNQDMEFGREGSVTIGTNKKWKMEIPIRGEENKFRVFLKDWEYIGYDLSLRGATPKLQWPYKDRDKKVDGSCNYKDTKDRQEPRIDNCYYKFPVSGWYGNTDLYMQTGKANGFHNAIDIAGTSGSSIYAVAKGEVFYINISDVDGTVGNYVLIDHGSWVSAYMHLSTINIDGLTTPTASKLIKPSIVVEAGQKIGETGKSGCSDCGPHLHFSVFLWTNGYREVSLKENSIPSIPWTKDTTAFKLININPPAGEALGSNIHYKTGELLGFGENSTDRLADRRNADKPEVYFSPYDFWKDVNWNEIRINEYGCESGTKFDELNESNQCATQTP